MEEAASDASASPDASSADAPASNTYTNANAHTGPDSTANT